MWHLFQQWAETASVANMVGVVALWVIAIWWAWSVIRSGREESVAEFPRVAATALRAQIRRDVHDRHARAVEGRGHPADEEPFGYQPHRALRAPLPARLSEEGHAQQARVMRFDESGYSGTRITMSKPEDAA